MTTNLPEAQERGKDGEAVAARFATGLVGVLEDVAAALGENGAVDFALLGGELAERGEFQLRRGAR